MVRNMLPHTNMCMWWTISITNSLNSNTSSVVYTYRPENIQKTLKYQPGKNTNLQIHTQMKVRKYCTVTEKSRVIAVQKKQNKYFHTTNHTVTHTTDIQKWYSIIHHLIKLLINYYKSLTQPFVIHCACFQTDLKTRELCMLTDLKFSVGKLEGTDSSKICQETDSLSMGAVLWHSVEESVVTLQFPHNITGSWRKSCRAKRILCW